MHRLTNQETRGHDGAHSRGRKRLAAEMHTVCASGKCDVEAIVEDDAGDAAAHRVDSPPREIEQGPAIEVTFSDLDQLYATCHRVSDLAQHGLRCGIRKTPAVGDHADDRSHDGWTGPVATWETESTTLRLAVSRRSTGRPGSDA